MTANFVQSLFQGKLNQEAVFPYPALNKEPQETLDILLEGLKKFCLKEVDDQAIDEAGQIPKAVMDGLAEMGVMGMIIPEEYDGFELPMRSYCRVIDELAFHSASVGLTVGAHQSIGLKGIPLFGNAEQKKKYLPPLATGKHYAAYALTESHAGSDTNNNKTIAVLSEDGKHYILNGAKIWITNAGFAQTFTTFAKVSYAVKNKDEKPVKKGMTAFIVTRDMPGVTVSPPEKKMGIKGSATNEVCYDNVKVPVENRLGEEGDGLRIAMEILFTGRLSLAAGCIGGARSMLEKSTAFALQRKTFGKVIAEHQAIKAKLGEMTALIYTMEAMTYLTCGMADAGGVDYALEGSCCKIFCTEALWQVCDQAVQINGGHGYMKEYPYERCLRDARINRIYEGTTEVLLFFTGIAGMMETTGYVKKANKLSIDELSALEVENDKALKLTGIPEELSSEKIVVEEAVRELWAKSQYLVHTYGRHVLEKQHLLMRVTRMTVSVYGMVSVLSRYLKANNQADLPIVKCAIAILSRQFNEQASGIEKNYDALLDETAELICARNGVI